MMEPEGLAEGKPTCLRTIFIYVCFYYTCIHVGFISNMIRLELAFQFMLR